MEEKKGTETSAAAIPPQEDAESKIAALEAEKANLLKDVEVNANYKVAYLKEKSKNKESNLDEEDAEEKMRRIASETLAGSRLAEIAREQDAIIKKALKENTELKLAQMNKADIPASTTSHSEGQAVKDTMVTPEQIAAFKAKGWSDKDIERYKKNLVRYGR